MDGFIGFLLAVGAILAGIGLITTLTAGFNFVSSVYSSQQQISELQDRVNHLERHQVTFYTEPSSDFIQDDDYIRNEKGK